MANFNGNIFANRIDRSADKTAGLINGLAGNDTLSGGSGSDTIDGGTGNDVMSGGLGSDTYVVDSLKDKVLENANAGTDTIRSSVSLALDTFAVNVENLLLMGAAALSGAGNALNNVLTGNGGNNSLSGLAGDDTLNGLAGQDSLSGGVGRDVLAGGAGNDTLVGGADGDLISGDAGADVIVFSRGDGHDTVQADGLDTLLVKGGLTKADLTVGLLGAVTEGAVVLDWGKGDAVTLTQAGNWDGLNIVFADGSRLTGAEIVAAATPQPQESAYQGGTAGNDSLVGNDRDHVLDGLAGDDWLVGGSGRDTLYGGAGQDTLDGGAGDDTYLIDDLNDVVIDSGAGGIDTAMLFTNLPSEQSYAYEVGSGLENFTLVEGSLATKARGNALANVLQGNSLDNGLSGGDAADTLLGDQGNDLLEGGAGADVLVGGAGADTVIGGDGPDTLRFSRGDGQDQASLNGLSTIALGQGIVRGDLKVGLLQTGIGQYSNFHASYIDLDLGQGDSIRVNISSASREWIVPSLTFADGAIISGPDLVILATPDGNHRQDTLGGGLFSGSGTVHGGIGNDLLMGSAGNDVLEDGEGVGDDTLNGGQGDDTMIGGQGMDVYIVDSVGDVVIERPASEYSSWEPYANNVNDRILTSVSLEGLALNVENAQLTGTANLKLRGNEQDTTLIGNIGNNVLEGLGGNDTLVADSGEGDDGADTLIGGAGDDVYQVDSESDQIVELSAGGNDTLVTSLAVKALAASLENATLVGNAALNLTGNGEDNRLQGNDAANVILGLGGNDTLVGGGDIDTLDGGQGNDTYEVSDNRDVIVDSGSAGDVDTILTSVSLDALPDTIENATFKWPPYIQANTVRLTGNASDNVLTSVNLVGSVLSGLDGNDVLLANNDYYADTLIGGAGDDTMQGGGGGDTYFVDSLGDVVIDLGGYWEMNDTIITTVSLPELASGIERGILLGSADLNLKGNGLRNYLQGNDGNNVLDGAGGSDSLDGGLGNDTLIGSDSNDAYYIDSLGDVIVEPGGGWNVIYTSLDMPTLGEAFADVHLLGDKNLSAVGNTASNLLEGNDGNNVLNGQAGGDTLQGGLGNDTLMGGQGNDVYVIDSLGDVIVEDGAASDLDSVVSSITIAALNNALENGMLTGTANLDLSGNAKANELVGNAGNNILLGLGGNDRIFGGEGNDYLSGGDGDDSLNDSLGKDTLDGGAGNDVLTSAGGASLLNGGDGNDTLQGSYSAAAADTLRGGKGDDVYVLSSSQQTVIETDQDGGVDTVFTYISIDALIGNIENVEVKGSQWITTVGGNELANRITSDGVYSNYNVNLDGRGGDDYISGSRGLDTLHGGEGNDTLVGGGDTDVLNGDAGNDLLMGGARSDHYVQAGNFGSDAIVESSTSTSGNWDDTDDMLFQDVSYNSLWFKQLGTDLEVSVVGTANKVTIQGWFDGTSHVVERITDLSSTPGSQHVIQSGKVAALVGVMAQFAPQNMSGAQAPAALVAARDAAWALSA